MTRGLITIALGAATYLRMAKDLALSARRHCPSLPRAVVTDAPAEELRALFDVVLSCDRTLGDPFFQKLWLERYSPFDETLFVDCDSLLAGDLDETWRLVEGREFGYVGELRSAGEWYKADLVRVCERLGVPSLATLNSGLLVFRRGEAAALVFATAREAMSRYDGLGFARFRGGFSDEIGLALALSQLRIAPIDDPEGRTMRTPIGIEGEMDIDVLDGRCRFVKCGRPVAPEIVHFATWQFHPIYYRERAKLRLAAMGPLVRPLARPGAAYVYTRELLLARMRRVKSP